MHPIVLREFKRIAARLNIAGSVLEVGAVAADWSLIALDELAGCERIGINLGRPKEFNGARILQMNGNDMAEFADGRFDAVLCNATLEHDPRFWLTCAEIRRVLKPGGVAVIGVPGFAPSADLVRLGVTLYSASPAEDYDDATLTFMYHGAPDDYYRFSESALRQVFFAGYRDVEVRAVMKPPRLIGIGWKSESAA